MNLLEFITYCELANLIEYRQQTTVNRHKVLMRRGEVEVSILYEIYDGKGAIIKSTLDHGCGKAFHLSPALSTIVEAFFPSK